MARLTVEDCLQIVDNRYDLVSLASKRARQLGKGIEPLLEAEADKPTVIALREIAAGRVNDANIDKLGQPQFDEEMDRDIMSAMEFKAALPGATPANHLDHRPGTQFNHQLSYHPGHQPDNRPGHDPGNQPED